MVQAYQTRNPPTVSQDKEDESCPPSSKVDVEANGTEDAKTPTSIDLPIPGGAFVAEALTKLTFYELLNTQEGFLALQSYFIQAVLLLDRDGSAEQGGGP